ncbi:hypothetical protein J2Y45_004701 [Dyadobacter sp. BE34]|uniref:WG repeat-containing protein n=1 Tax=Dyadobacter fermentans TaxID=94254 RepID=A0ABU1R258_9BACT|nr:MULTISPECIES: hypothetical protein [Dyadobacter]MDR6807501.1 hypothetical protein [Dyadobacter fermentans]MDR7045242.1 hypothetical protein [Dyadobacter sp. BE242]MDR7199555.1 hypothetical protein [Dyadobacter sp. BE34]MDR7217986.1 hypothetical protein [Dyadobacter sp. BE31]MDR7265446.1 hypothetical protein [Dyadobacter sp. BE32]
MKNTLILFIFLLISSAQTCAAQDASKVAAQEYESCCGTQPVEFSYEKKRIYVPNVFTPNRDGVNDYFFPVVNDVVTDVWGFAVYSIEGDTMLYQKPYFNSKMPVQEYGWDGLRPDGSRYKGAFRYKMRVDDMQANKHIVEGRACAIICGSGSEVFQTKSGCYFPVQAGKDGTLDKSIASGEKGCF